MQCEAHTTPVFPCLRPLPHRLISAAWVRIAFLAPELQRAILGSSLPGLTLEQLMRTPMPSLWSEQGTLFEARGYPANLPRRLMVGADQNCALLI